MLPAVSRLVALHGVFIKTHTPGKPNTPWNNGLYGTVRYSLRILALQEDESWGSCTNLFIPRKKSRGTNLMGGLGDLKVGLHLVAKGTSLPHLGINPRSFGKQLRFNVIYALFSAWPLSMTWQMWSLQWIPLCHFVSHQTTRTELVAVHN
jgi:hypothetical protein